MFGPQATKAADLEPAERRDIWLRALAAQYGANALSPRAHLETDWAAEGWSLGGMIAHFAPGVLTNFGHALREPAGRIHWAGTERATEMHGLMEGAVAQASARQTRSSLSPRSAPRGQRPRSNLTEKVHMATDGSSWHLADMSACSHAAARRRRAPPHHPQARSASSQ